VMSSGWP